MILQNFSFTCKRFVNVQNFVLKYTIFLLNSKISRWIYGTPRIFIKTADLDLVRPHSELKFSRSDDPLPHLFFNLSHWEKNGEMTLFVLWWHTSDTTNSSKKLLVINLFVQTSKVEQPSKMESKSAWILCNAFHYIDFGCKIQKILENSEHIGKLYYIGLNSKFQSPKSLNVKIQLLKSEAPHSFGFVCFCSSIAQWVKYHGIKALFWFQSW